MIAEVFAEAMKKDDGGGELEGVGEGWIEVEDELGDASGGAGDDGAIRSLFFIEDGGVAQGNEGSISLPEEDLVSFGEPEFDGLADEEGLPVEAIHERVFFRDDSSAEVAAALGGFVDHDDAIGGREFR